jgi:hypothetical protein
VKDKEVPFGFRSGRKDGSGTFHEGDQLHGEDQAGEHAVFQRSDHQPERPQNDEGGKREHVSRNEPEQQRAKIAPIGKFRGLSPAFGTILTC